jgi:hypothetical protein
MPAWEREVPSFGPEFGLAALNVDVNADEPSP